MVCQSILWGDGNSGQWIKRNYYRPCRSSILK